MRYLRLLRFGADIVDQRPGPAQADHVEADRHARAAHLLVGDVLEHGFHPAAAVLLRPGHAEVTGGPYLVLPLPQEFQLPLVAHFHKGLRQQEAGVRRIVVLHPGGDFRPELL